ncbi:MAG: hypothetical protein H6865_06620 [Rhodospirillales bacterium]|nr:hypothetical protein [Alphaproteobacteria bacterium]MCB9987294.1 hypothetical protein [Rhodospirillales bacterium]USO07849.1 MAG: hypothetical protein H6866_01080 [Rhodospirillales bacterium]
MKRLLLPALTVILLAGCAPASSTTSTAGGWSKATLAEQKAVRERADYWQRADSVSAQYLTGPKAQQQLNMDLAACVAEVRELVRLGSIRKAEPPSTIAMSNGMRAGWVSPTRDGPLHTEYTDFQDFDGCMKSKGWDRVDYVKPVTAKAAAANFVDTILGHPYGWDASQQSYDSTQNDNFNH